MPKSITFSRWSRGYRARLFSDDCIYLEDLAKGSLFFRMLLTCEKFTAVAGDVRIIGYTDKYGNKIIRYE